MLIELRCEKLIKNKVTFHQGLNVLIGPDDGSNSIGKSSVLMLIDFALAGDDFIKLCSDVIENIGSITIEMDFLFDNEIFSFSRSTDHPKIVNFLHEKKNSEKTINDYRDILKEKFLFPNDSSSFRGALNPFLRIWGKDNYNPNKPLNSFPSEKYSNVRMHVLQLFSYYGLLHDLENEKTKSEIKKKALRTMFSAGYIKYLSKRDLASQKKRIKEIEIQLNELKKNIELYTININQIVNDENLKLKAHKDHVSNLIFHAKSRLKRIEDNLKYGSTINKKHFEKLKAYFPNVNRHYL